MSKQIIVKTNKNLDDYHDFSALQSLIMLSDSELNYMKKQFALATEYYNKMNSAGTAPIQEASKLRKHSDKNSNL